MIADLVLLLHFGIVLFVVGGLVLVVLGNLQQWHWVNHWWFRALHLLAIGIVVAESWLGIECPLTTFEHWLRLQAGQAVHADAGQSGFIQHWVHAVLFYQAPAWVFTGVYSVFGMVVLAAWVRWPPEKLRNTA